MRKISISSKISYIRNLYAPEDQLLQEISNSIIADDLPINIGSEEGKLIQLLIKLAKVTTIVEIGTHYGYSTIWMARALPVNGKLYTIEKDSVRASKAKGFFSRFEQPNLIELIEGDAITELKLLSLKAPFDMVFIDANKKAYPEYIDWAYPHLKQGGLIIADNSLLSNAVFEAQDQQLKISASQIKAMQLFNYKLADSSKYFSIIIPTQEGLSVAIKL